jgi:hypothetical protein
MLNCVGRGNNAGILAWKERDEGNSTADIVDKAG